MNTALKTRLAHREAPMADHVPHGTVLTPHIVLTRQRELHTTFRVSGISFETVDETHIDVAFESVHNYLRSLGGGHVGFVQHKIRRKITDRLDGKYENPIAQAITDAYFDTFKGYRMMAVELYLTVIYRPAAGKLKGALKQAKRRALSDIKVEHHEAIQAVEDIAKTTRSMLRKFDVEQLGTYEHKGVTYSEQLEFYGFLLNGEWMRVPVRSTPVREYLPVSRVTFSDFSELGELRTPLRTRYVAMLDFQDYPGNSEPGMTNVTLYGNFEYIETQSFAMLGRRDGMKVLERQKGHLMASGDAAERQIKQIDKAIEDLAEGEIEMGEYHYTLAVFGADLDEVRRNKAEAVAQLAEGAGFKVVAVDAVPEGAWFAQLPGNWKDRPREAWLTSRNFAMLACMHNFAAGKRDRNPWGECVTIFQTPNGQPFYFNFHVQPDDEDSTDKKYPANTTIIGQTGSGKTVVELYLVASCLKYPGYRAVIFDRDRGCEIAVRALSGIYFAIETGKSTGWSPMKMEPTERNILMLEGLVKKLTEHVAYPFTVKDEADISHAVRAVMRMPREIRRLGIVRQNLPNTSENSVSARLAKWCKGGPLAWVFDNDEDRLDFSGARLYGFDYTEVLDNAEIRTPVMMYLLYMTESMIDGRPFSFVIAEYWKALEDEFFTDFSKNKLKVIRKEKGLGIFDTQSPSDCLASPIGKTIVEQSVTKLFLPNPFADHDDYVNGFKVTEAEFEIIKSLPETSRCFLVKQGQRSAVVRFDLSGLDEVINILSASTDNIELLDSIRADVGDDPAVWVPIFHARLAERKGAAKIEKPNSNRLGGAQ
jgi:type IV secretion system protein VirB4